MTSQPESVGAKKTRVRSPAYPFISLPKAIDYARKFWDNEKKNFAPVAVAYGHFGFAVAVGGQTVSALIQFGLMESSGEKENRKVKLTDHAIRILGSTDEKSEAFMKMIRRSALLPKLYASLMSKYASGLPSDAVLCHELEFEREFNKTVIPEVVRAFRETVSFAKLDEPDTLPTSEADRSDIATDIEEVDDVSEVERAIEPRAGVPAIARKAAAPAPAADDPGEVERLRFNLKGGRRVRLMFTGRLPTQEDIDKLIANLQLNKDTFPETAEDDEQ